MAYQLGQAFADPSSFQIGPHLMQLPYLMRRLIHVHQVLQEAIQADSDCAFFTKLYRRMDFLS